jgi:hypothetical protein
MILPPDLAVWTDTLEDSGLIFICVTFLEFSRSIVFPGFLPKYPRSPQLQVHGVPVDVGIRICHLSLASHVPTILGKVIVIAQSLLEPGLTHQT